MENNNHQNEVKMNYKGDYRQQWEVDGEVKEKDVGDVKGSSESKWENGKDANLYRPQRATIASAIFSK